MTDDRNESLPMRADQEALSERETMRELRSIPGMRRYLPAVGPRLHKLLYLVLTLFLLLAINSVYLVSVTISEWYTGVVRQNYFYQYMFLAHLGLGLCGIFPLFLFAALHVRNAKDRPNRLAVRVGYALLVAATILVLTGLLLTRIEGVFDLKHPTLRRTIYWIHAVSPLAVIWFYILHRLAGPPLKWRAGIVLAALGVASALVMMAMHGHDPRTWKDGDAVERDFAPSFSKTASGHTIPEGVFMNDAYCMKCHPDVYEDWSHSMHRMSSFNNPAYAFSIKALRKELMARDGNVEASRFCAGCHDPVPLFAGTFDDPNFDVKSSDGGTSGSDSASAGITCTVCHGIVSVDSPRGNGDYTIDEPVHYPFAGSQNSFLRWVNAQLIKAKPAFHKRTFLRPLHRTPEFCGTCHKVHLPKELNDYKWLRGQNHYDSYHLSGVSGHGASSFYYPEKAEENCNGCHMPLIASGDFGAAFFDDSNELKVHGHQFPSANTAIPHMLRFPEKVNEAHRRFLDGVVRVDLFGLKRGEDVSGQLLAPLRPTVPELVPGETYLIETVIRTLRLGHLLTEGTSDSNELWIDVSVTTNGLELIGRSGGMLSDGSVDPWSHFINSYVLDRQGRRIDRRNVQDVFVSLWNHQIPPGAADVVHYRLRVPEDVKESITVTVKVLYRKFDTTFYRHLNGAAVRNDLPVTTLAIDKVTLPVRGTASTPFNRRVETELWERWNDYGIGLLRKGNKGSSRGELRQAEAAFRQVQELGKVDGLVNRARVYIKEGRLAEAVQVLGVSAKHDPPPLPWTLAWLTGVVNKQNGRLAAARESFSQLARNEFAAAADRGFDFSQDYRVLNELGLTIFEESKRERGEARRERRQALQREAIAWFQKTLRLDPENTLAHHNLALIYARLGMPEEAEAHRVLHERYRPDENARDRAVTQHRAENPAADHAAEAVVIYDLQRVGAYELPPDRAVEMEK